MGAELKRAIYKTILTYPAKSDYQIAREMNLSRSLVYRCRLKIIKTIDYELARNVAGKFLIEFQQASDYFKMQIERLEDLKLAKYEEIQFKRVKDDEEYDMDNDKYVLERSGKLYEKVTVIVDATHKDILDIEKHQTKLWENILFLARQGEGIEILKAIQDGRITETNQTIPEISQEIK